ncbi:3'-5' exonuclease [Malassezia nana]|uniref:RNA exonuclease 4 n=1 Tax=Malassezia nana TaxID=180528 RepID=A0AAF0EQ01_9BASI|nr:3'-5' exonuclease [Malassezia nana]
MGTQKRASSNWIALKKKMGTSSSARTRRKRAQRAARPATTPEATAAPAVPNAPFARPIPTLKADARPGAARSVTATIHTTKVTSASMSTSATAPLPWFAEDLTPEDLALALPRSQSADNVVAEPNRTQQWEGYMDEETKRRVILGDERDMTAEKREVGHYVAVDCEMVGVGPRGSRSALARVSIVNWYGHVVLDRFVKPKELVTDYRTWVSGVRPKHLRDAPSFETVQQEVADIFRGRVVVGHAIDNDLKALLLSHPRALLRDTAHFQPLREIAGTKHPGLRRLCELVLGIHIQQKGKAHSSVEDARATMALFRTQKEAWDRALGHAKPARRHSTSSLPSRPKAAEAWWGD